MNVRLDYRAPRPVGENGFARDLIDSVTGGIETRRDKIVVGFTAVYFALTQVLIVLAFDFEGRIDVVWTVVLCLVTLPWSAVTILFTWPLIHGAGLAGFAIFYTIAGFLNGYLLGRAVATEYA